MVHFSMLVALLVPVACEHDEPPTMPNIGYLLGGYNIFRGNPLATTPYPIDPGFTRGSIYAANYSGGTTTDDKRFSIPTGVEVHTATSCSIDKDGEEATSKSSQDYRQSLSKEASYSVGASMWSAAFSASDDFKSADEQITNSKARVVSSSSVCTTYRASIAPTLHPDFQLDFLAAIELLPEEYGDGAAYYTFFENYGTHSIYETVMGARYGFRCSFSEDGWKSVESTGTSVSRAASLHLFTKAGGDKSSLTKTEEEAESAFASNYQHSHEVTLGSKPSGGDVVEWSKQSFESPMPISVKLETICKLLPSVTSTPPSKKQQNCKDAANDSEYCEKYLLKTGDVDFCTGTSYDYLSFDCHGHRGHDLVFALSEPVNGKASWKDAAGNQILWKHNASWYTPYDNYTWELSDSNGFVDAFENPTSDVDPTGDWSATCKLAPVDGCKWDDECEGGKCEAHVCRVKTTTSRTTTTTTSRFLRCEDVEPSGNCKGDGLCNNPQVGKPCSCWGDCSCCFFPCGCPKDIRLPQGCSWRSMGATQNCGGAGCARSCCAECGSGLNVSSAILVF